MPFREVFGHRRLVGLLARSIRRDRLPPSLIFAGPHGIGKHLIAGAVAQALNCTARLEADPPLSSNAAANANGIDALEIDACGVCAACTRIARGVHPDVLRIEPGETGSIKIEQVRDLIDRAQYRPFEGRRRAVIIDDADALVGAAQNALLKTLEEPPPSSVFILVTARLDVLLPTVRSRCHLLRFRPLDAEDVAAALVTRGRTAAEARAVAATADGSLGQALEAEAGDLVEARDAAVRVLAQAASGDDPRRRVESAKDLLAKTGAKGGDRDHLAAHLRVMASLLRDVELLSTGGEAGALANPDVRPAIERLSAFSGERGILAFGAVRRALAALERNAGVKTVADWVVLQL